MVENRMLYASLKNISTRSSALFWLWQIENEFQLVGCPHMCVCVCVCVCAHKGAASGGRSLGLRQDISNVQPGVLPTQNISTEGCGGGGGGGWMA